MTITPIRRDQILVEATHLFVQRGYDGISMNDIAAAAKLSKPGIYHHFKDKEDLFLALLEENLDKLADILEKTAALPGTCREHITEFTRALFEQMDADQRAVIRLANQEMSKLSQPRREKFNDHYQQIFLARLDRLFDQGIQSKELKPLEPRLMVWVFLGMLYPLFSAPSETRPATGGEIALTALEIFFDGVAR
jgi:AcrR family transcriptional regulator